MASRPVVHVTRLVAAGALALAFTQPLAAQNPPQVIFRGDGGAFNIISSANLTLSDAAVRSLIETNLPEALLGDSAKHIVLVVDANDRYVSGKVTNAMVISANGDDGVGVHRIVIGDTIATGAANVVVMRRDGSEAAAAGALPFAVSVLGAKLSEGSSANGVFGSGVSPADVGSIGMRRYAPGTLGSANMIVTVVKLK
jgi:hypothetical protein